MAVEEAPLEQTENGLVARGGGWFVLNARDSQWWHADGRGAFCDFEAGTTFEQVGMGIYVLQPGDPMSMYHWENDQEDFLVLSGEALLIVEGDERPLVPWDFAHFPPHAAHTIVGAGSGPCVIVAVGAREHQGGEDWGAYPVDDAALRHGVGVEEETNRGAIAYANGPKRSPTRYDGWLGE